MTLRSPAGVPRIIHQTWRSSTIEIDKGDPASWRALNPGWDYRFWSDDALRAFMAAEFPDLLAMYDGYAKPVQRADLARYCLMKRFGGLYADIDTRCLASLDPLAQDGRVILCQEPVLQHDPAVQRGLKALWFNGTMASPAGHPFWDLVIDHCKTMYPRQKDGDILETTGPVLLSAAVEQWADPSQLALSSSGLFAGQSSDGAKVADPAFGPYGHLCLSEHLWQGSWYSIATRPSWLRRKHARLRQLRHALSLAPKLTPAAARRQTDLGLLTRPLAQATQPPQVSILVPVRDGAAYLEQNLAAIRTLTHPRDRLRLYYGVGPSTDGTEALVRSLIDRHGAEFAEMAMVPLHRNGPPVPRETRWKSKYQLARRAGIAMARNDLLAAALPQTPDWFLWLDADIIGLPQDLVAQLLGAGAKIVTPDCTRVPGGPSHDLNAFLTVGHPGRVELYRNIRHGLFQPPADFWFRRHLHDLRYLDRVPLDGVGGTALLVHSDVHRAGLVFPEKPYRHLIETEGFAAMARDLGIRPVGLPRVSVLHHDS